MRYAIFTDIHANLEALQAVLTKIDELAEEEPIEQIWFLGDLVGYGPNPNECIELLRARTDVIIAGNHDWAAVGKIDLEDFSEAARISAEWTAKQLTEENRDFLINLPERIEKGMCTLVHGSPYGPLWEYLTSEVLAERSFEYFSSTYCFVGHTHVPVIFQQPDVANAPTIPLSDAPKIQSIELTPEDLQPFSGDELSEDDETQKLVIVRSSTVQNTQKEEEQADSEVHLDPSDVLSRSSELQHLIDDEHVELTMVPDKQELPETVEIEVILEEEAEETAEEEMEASPERAQEIEITPEENITNAEDRLNQEIEELLTLLGLSQSMVSLTNEMILPPEMGHWHAPRGYRAIVNPGGVGQPRDGNPKAAFMIFDPEKGFEFYRVAYTIEKTQEKIIEAGLPKYLATRLSYGR
jgi:predicted phosphodiesterase